MFTFDGSRCMEVYGVWFCLLLSAGGMVEYLSTSAITYVAIMREGPVVPFRLWGCGKGFLLCWRLTAHEEQ